MTGVLLTWVCLVAGLVLVLRAAAIIVTSGEGRFRFDASLTGLLGFAVMLVGLALAE